MDIRTSIYQICSIKENISNYRISQVNMLFDAWS